MTSTHLGSWLLRKCAVPLRAQSRFPPSPKVHRSAEYGGCGRSRVRCTSWRVLARVALTGRSRSLARVRAYSVDTPELDEQAISGRVVSVVGGRVVLPVRREQQQSAGDCVAAQLRQTGSLGEVMQIVAASRGCLTCEAIAQAVFTIAYLKKRSRGAAGQEEGKAREALLGELEEYVTGGEVELSPRAVANMMRSFCDLRRLHGGVRDALEAYCLAHVDHFRSNDIAKVLYACASSGQAGGPLFRGMEARIQHVAAFFTPTEVATLAWAYASSGNRSKVVFAALRAQLSRTAPAMNAQDVTTTLWAFAAAGFAARPVLNTLRPMVLANLPFFNQQDIGTTARAFSYASCLDSKLCVALATHALRQAQMLSPHSMAALAGAFGQAGFVSEPLCVAIETAVLRQPSAFRTLDLQQIMGGFLAAGVPVSAQLGKVVKEELSGRVVRMSSRKLADTLISFKICNLESFQLRQVISEEVASRAPSMTPAEISTCLEAFSQLGPVPETVLDCVEREVIRRSLRFPPPLMVKVLATFVREKRIATQLFSVFEMQVLEGLDDLCPRDAGTLMAAYASAGKGSTSLYWALSACIAEGAWELAPKELCVALETLRVAREPGAEARLLRAAQSVVVHHAEDCSLRQLAFLVEAYALARIDAPDVSAAASQQASARMKSCDPVAACRLLKSFRAANYRPAASLLLQFQPLLVKAAPSMYLPALSGALRSYAALEVRAPELFAVAPAILLPKLARLDPVQVAYLAWAFVTTGEANEPAVQALLNEVEEELLLGRSHFERPEPVAALLWAYASANRFSSRLFAALAPVVVLGAGRLAPRDAVRVLWAYAVSACEAEVKLEVFSALEPLLRSQMGQLSSEELASAVWAFTSLGYDSTALFDAARQRIMSDALSAPSFEEDALEAGVWAMTALHDFENGGYSPTTAVSRLTVSMDTSLSSVLQSSEEEEEEEEGDDPWAAYEQHCVGEMCGSLPVIPAPLLAGEQGMEDGKEFEVDVVGGLEEGGVGAELSLGAVGLARAVKLHTAMALDDELTAGRCEVLAQEVGCSEAALRRWCDKIKGEEQWSEDTSFPRSHPVREEEGEAVTEESFMPSTSQLAVLEQNFGEVKRLMPVRRANIAAEIGASEAEVALWWATRKVAASAVSRSMTTSELAVFEGAYKRYGRLSPACKRDLRAQLGSHICETDMKKWFRSRHAQRRAAKVVAT